MAIRRYTMRLQCYVQPEIAAGFRALADQGAMSESAHMRTAMLAYLRMYGLGQQNGKAPARGELEQENRHDHEQP